MPQDTKTLRRYRAGVPLLQELTATHLNEVVDGLDMLRRDYAENVGSPQDGGGNPTNYTLAVITNTGPNGEADDPAHNVYWLKTQRVKSTVKIGDSVELEDETTPGIWEIVQATNLAEAKTSHSMRTDETVFVKLYRLQGSSSPGSGHHVFWAGGGNVAPILCGAPTARGFYAGTIMIPATGNIDPTSDISSAALFNTGATHVILFNLVEMGILQGSTLIQGLTYNALYHSTNDDGTQVYGTSGWDVGAGLMRVPITKVGGSVGTLTTPSSWTYDAAGGLLSAASPTVGRPNGALSAATEGLVYYDFSSNTMKLLYAFEGLPTGPCVPSS